MLDNSFFVPIRSLPIVERNRQPVDLKRTKEKLKLLRAVHQSYVSTQLYSGDHVWSSTHKPISFRFYKIDAQHSLVGLHIESDVPLWSIDHQTRLILTLYSRQAHDCVYSDQADVVQCIGASGHLRMPLLSLSPSSLQQLVNL